MLNFGWGFLEASPAAVYSSLTPKFVAATHKRKLITNSALKLATTTTTTTTTKTTATTIIMNEGHNE